MVYRHKPKDSYEEKMQSGRTEWNSKEHYLQDMRDSMASSKAKYAGGSYNPNMESYFSGAAKTVGHVPGKYYKVQFTAQNGTVDTYIGEKRWEKYGGKEDWHKQKKVIKKKEAEAKKKKLQEKRDIKLNDTFQKLKEKYPNKSRDALKKMTYDIVDGKKSKAKKARIGSKGG